MKKRNRRASGIIVVVFFKLLVFLKKKDCLSKHDVVEISKNGLWKLFLDFKFSASDFDLI